MDQNEVVLSQVERLRFSLSIQWGKLITLSGAIVLKHPRFYSCLRGLLLLIARDDNVRHCLLKKDPMELLSIKLKDPILELKPEKSINSSNKELLEELIKYRQMCNEFHIDASKLKEVCIQMEEMYNTQFDFWIGELTKPKHDSGKEM
jgi:hypothetical protein